MTPRTSRGDAVAFRPAEHSTVWIVEWVGRSGLVATSTVTGATARAASRAFRARHGWAVTVRRTSRMPL